MRVFALSDPHLSFATPGKKMDRFGDQWVNHVGKMARAWDETVSADDLVLVPGDVSWAMKPTGAAPDLAWLADRPGTKVISRGNHDYWWTTRSRVQGALADGCFALDATAARVGDVAIGATRLWDVPGVSMD